MVAGLRRDPLAGRRARRGARDRAPAALPGRCGRRDAPALSPGPASPRPRDRPARRHGLRLPDRHRRRAGQRATVRDRADARRRQHAGARPLARPSLRPKRGRLCRAGGAHCLCALSLRDHARRSCLPRRRAATASRRPVRCTSRPRPRSTRRSPPAARPSVPLARPPARDLVVGERPVAGRRARCAGPSPGPHRGARVARVARARGVRRSGLVSARRGLEHPAAAHGRARVVAHVGPAVLSTLLSRLDAGARAALRPGDPDAPRGSVTEPDRAGPRRPLDRRLPSVSAFAAGLARGDAGRALGDGERRHPDPRRRRPSRVGSDRLARPSGALELPARAPVVLPGPWSADSPSLRARRRSAWLSRGPRRSPRGA